MIPIAFQPPVGAKHPPLRGVGISTRLWADASPLPDQTRLRARVCSISAATESAAPVDDHRELRAYPVHVPNPGLHVPRHFDVGLELLYNFSPGLANHVETRAHDGE
jgi:hypothetical protein